MTKKEFCDVCEEEIKGVFTTNHFYFHEPTPTEELPRKTEIHSADLCTEHGRLVWDYIQSLREEER